MKQVMLLFRKDVRHLWRELGVYAAILVCFAVIEPQARAPGAEGFLVLFATLLKVLITACWLVLIAGAVHADNPVGDTQFWLTRPYKWSALLGAKTFFMVVCVLLPLAVMQLCLLFLAALSPFDSVGGMVFTLAAFLLSVMLPMMLIAAVTETLTAAFLSIAGLLVLLAAFMQFALSRFDMRMPPRNEFEIFAPVFAPLMIGVLVFQYARRDTRRSRFAIAAVFVLILLVRWGVDSEGFGAPIRRLIEEQYRVLPNDSLRLNFAPGTISYEERSEEVTIPKRFSAYVAMRLPVQLEGLANDERIHEPHVAFDVVGPSVSYSSPWEDVTVTEHAIRFLIPKKVLDELGHASAQLHLELAAEQLHASDIRRVAVGEKFAGPRGGECVMDDGKVACHYAYSHETPTRVIANFQANTCGVRGDRAATSLLNYPPGSRLDPVIQEPIRIPKKLCAGDVMEFHEFSVERRFRSLLDLSGMDLSQYVVR